jgi:hypothetical protein
MRLPNAYKRHGLSLYAETIYVRPQPKRDCGFQISEAPSWNLDSVISNATRCTQGTGALRKWIRVPSLFANLPRQRCFNPLAFPLGRIISQMSEDYR